MGIRQLTSYVEQNRSILFSELLDLNGMKLVFDGSSLYYTLMRRVPRRFGGDYSKLSACFREFFTKLASYNIEPYIILDGGLNIPLKTETICGRISRNINALGDLTDLHSKQVDFPIPILTKYAFIEVLLELGTNFVVAKKEADLLIAALANRLCCPVVTADSDFYVTNVHYGVIPMDNIIKLKSPSCYCYKVDSLCQHLKLDAWMLPFLAVIMGNDYSSEVFLMSIQRTCGIRKSSGKMLPLRPRMQCIAEYLRKFTSVREVISSFCSDVARDQNELQNEIENILLEFDVDLVKDECNELFDVLMRIEPIAANKIHGLKDNPESLVLTLTRRGLVNASVIDIFSVQSHFVNVQCENMKMKCSSHLSQTLRKYIYAILLKNPRQDVFNVTEYRRFGRNYKKVLVEVFTGDLKELPTISSDSDKCKAKFLCDLFEFSMEHLEKIQPDAHLFLMSIRYWVKQTFLINEKLQIEHIHALLIGFLHFLGERVEERHTPSIVDLVTFHHFCRWQSILNYMRILNDLMLRPIYCGCVKIMFNGTFVHNVYHQLVQGESPYTLIDESQKDIFGSFVQVICEGIADSIQHKLPKSAKGKKKTKQMSQKVQPSFSNRFAALTMAGGEEEENELTDD